jgi:hypothetical protein
MLKIEEGKFYRTRDGQKVGPMNPSISGGSWPWECLGSVYSDSGVRWYGASRPETDLVAEWVDLTAITTPYGLLPEEVRRALREHKGDYEYYSHVAQGCWLVVADNDPCWSPTTVYRAKPPKPVVKDVPLVVWVDGVKTRTTWTFTDGQMTPVAAVEVLK